MSEHAKYREMYDFLCAPQLPTIPEHAVVFGRADTLVAHAAGDLVIAGLAETIVITGAIGKDSGDILDRGYRSEAAFLEHELAVDALRLDYSLPLVTLETKALDGVDNAQFSLKKLGRQGADISTLTAVAHGTSLARLAETLRFHATQASGKPTVVHRKPSDYWFDLTNQRDQREAALELLRLADYPDKGLLLEQPELPENLVDFARDIYGEAPLPPPRLKKAMLRRVPAKQRIKILQKAAGTK